MSDIKVIVHYLDARYGEVINYKIAARDGAKLYDISARYETVGVKLLHGFGARHVEIFYDITSRQKSGDMQQ